MNAHPNLLGIDASDSACSIGLQYFDPILNSVHVDSIILNNTKSQGAVLLPAIDDVLKNHGLTLDDIDAFVLSNGPGRFTGLRIAAACIQGLAYCTDKKVILMSSLELQARQFHATIHAPEDKITWVCQKAYAGFYYQAKYRLIDNEIQRVTDEPDGEERYVKSYEEMSSEFQKNTDTYYYIGSGWDDICHYLKINTHNIISFQIDIKHALPLANIKYINNQMVSVCDVSLTYGVNPYVKS